MDPLLHRREPVIYSWDTVVERLRAEQGGGLATSGGGGVSLWGVALFGAPPAHSRLAAPCGWLDSGGRAGGPLADPYRALAGPAGMGRPRPPGVPEPAPVLPPQPSAADIVAARLARDPSSGGGVVDVDVHDAVGAVIARVSDEYAKSCGRATADDFFPALAADDAAWKGALAAHASAFRDALPWAGSPADSCGVVAGTLVMMADMLVRDVVRMVRAPGGGPHGGAGPLAFGTASLWAAERAVARLVRDVRAMPPARLHRPPVLDKLSHAAAHLAAVKAARAAWARAEHAKGRDGAAWAGAAVAMPVEAAVAQAVYAAGSRPVRVEDVEADVVAQGLLPAAAVFGPGGDGASSLVRAGLAGCLEWEAHQAVMEVGGPGLYGSVHFFGSISHWAEPERNLT